MAAEKLAAEKLKTELAQQQQKQQQLEAEQRQAKQIEAERLEAQRIEAERAKQATLALEARRAEETQAATGRQNSTNLNAEQSNPRVNGSVTRAPDRISRLVADVSAKTLADQSRATAIQRPSCTDSSLETYLAQLEQLVLQLNMELGRRDQASSDPIQDLSQRVIDLNLENLALKEQLRQTVGQRHE